MIYILTVKSITFPNSLSFVLYMSMRIRNEQLTQEEFANEIGSSLPVAQAVEMMHTGGYEMAKTAEVL